MGNGGIEMLPPKLFYGHLSTFNYWLIAILIFVGAKLFLVKYKIRHRHYPGCHHYLKSPPRFECLDCTRSQDRGAYGLGTIARIERAILGSFYGIEDKILGNWKLIEWSMNGLEILTFLFFPCIGVLNAVALFHVDHTLDVKKYNLSLIRKFISVRAELKGASITNSRQLV